MEENIMKKRKILSALCAVVLGMASVSTLTFASAADEEEAIASDEATVSTEETTEYDDTTGQCGDDITYVLKDGVLTLSGTGRTYYAYFANRDIRKDVTELVIGDGIRSIGWHTFEGLDNLKKVNLPNSLKVIESYAFLMCGNLTDITIPSGVTSIGDGAFEGCNFTKINLPNSITSIGFAAFANCDSLKEITLPNSITTIEATTFGECDNLTTVTIPDSVTSIESNAFGYCSSLTEITIPDSVTFIGGWAFNECTSLKAITIENKKCVIGDDDTDDNGNTINSNATIIGYANSTAYDYAVKYNRKFIDIETGKTLNNSTSTTSTTTTSKKEQVTLGDINGDGSVNSIDAVFVLKDFASQILGNKTTLDVSTADMNDDGKINSSDAVIILKQYAQSLISK
jgi:hypothetical protein